MGEDTDSERESSEEEAADQKSLQDSIPTIRNPFGNLSGVDGGTRGYGSAGLAEVLNRQTQLEVQAACASQGVIEHLQNRKLPRQVAKVSHDKFWGPSIEGQTDSFCCSTDRPKTAHRSHRRDKRGVQCVSKVTIVTFSYNHLSHNIGTH